MQPRRLLLIRHAQAADAPVDADRPLTERGARHAAAIGAWLRRAGLVPDRVVVSPAVRAAQTWERAGAAVVPDVPAILDARIYDNTVEALLAIVRDTPGDVQTLAVVGHNPSIGVLASILDDAQGSPAARRDLGAGFPAGGVAVFALGTSFDDLAADTATLTDFTVPGD